MKWNSFEKRTNVYKLEKKKKKKKWVPNRFLSVPFGNRAIGAYGPFFTERVKLERAKYRLHEKIHPSGSNFFRNRLFFLARVNDPSVYRTKEKAKYI